MRTSIVIFCLMVVLPSLTVAQTIRQRSSTEGFVVGIQANTLGWSSDYFQYLDENASSGYGVGVWAGYGFTQRLQVFGQYDFTAMTLEKLNAQAFQFSHLTGGLRFNFSTTTQAFRPFLELGLAYRTAMLKQVINGSRYDDLLFQGETLHLGGGLNYALSLPVMLTLNGSFQTGGNAKLSINNISSTDKVDISTFRASIGILLNINEL